MKRAFLICALSVLVAVPASVGAYLVAFADQPGYEECPVSPNVKLVSTVVSPGAKCETLNPGTVHLARKTKSDLNETLMENCNETACRMGCTPEQANCAVQQMNIQKWESKPLPETAAVARSFTVQMNGDPAMVTTYCYPDDAYVTVDRAEGNLTLCAPQPVGEEIANLAA